MLVLWVWIGGKKNKLIKFNADFFHDPVLVLLQLEVVLLVQLELNVARDGPDAIDEDAEEDD